MLCLPIDADRGLVLNAHRCSNGSWVITYAYRFSGTEGLKSPSPALRRPRERVTDAMYQALRPHFRYFHAATTVRKHGLPDEAATKAKRKEVLRQKPVFQFPVKEAEAGAHG